jgi:hypothetical protein
MAHPGHRQWPATPARLQVAEEHEDHAGVCAAEIAGLDFCRADS